MTATRRRGLGDRLPFVRPTKTIFTVFGVITRDTDLAVTPTELLHQSGLDESQIRNSVALLKSLGLLDSSEHRTALWLEYQQEPHRRASIISEGVQTAFAALFRALPDPTHAKPTEVSTWFRENSRAAYAADARARTFHALSDHAQRLRASLPDPARPALSIPALTAKRDIATTPQAPLPVPITVTFQLPPTDNPAVYRAFLIAYKEVFGTAPPT